MPTPLLRLNPRIPHNFNLTPQTAPYHRMDAHLLYTHQASKKTAHSPSAAMSDPTLADLTYVTREDLSKTLLESDSAPSLPANLAIVDVRDSDHIGGHIRGSTWVPSSELDYKAPELVRTLKDKEVVVFHCVLSQQRGPSAALRYLREKKRLEGLEGKKGEEEVKGEEGEEKEKEGDEGGEGNGKEKGGKKEQKVLVLKGGFSEWQEKYGPDKRLTEAWQKDIWEFGY